MDQKNKLAMLIAEGKISVEELANAQDLIERAKLVKQGIEACRATISFPLGRKEIHCYSYMDSAGEYQSWGSCTSDGVFECSCNWGGDHVIGRCNLVDFTQVFLAMENKEFRHDLERFLRQQIEESKK